MIRTLTDSQRATLESKPVAIRFGVDIDDVKRDVHCPSGTMLAYYKQWHRTDKDFMVFMHDVITKPTGSALDGRITW